MVETTREQRREPPSRLVLSLVELHREIDVADLDGAPCIRAEHPYFPNARQVLPVAKRDALQQRLDPLCRLRPGHVTPLRWLAVRP